MDHTRHKVTVAAASMLSAVLGTIHAFSVFIPEWENLPHANRAATSLIYSLALVSLTIAVLFGHRIYSRLSPPILFAAVGVFASLGLALSSNSSSLTSLYLTYGLIFGGANGLGYGYALQLAGFAFPDRRGLAMGLVTAFYAVGATAAPVLFSTLIQQGGNALALEVMSAILLVTSLLCAALLYWSKARYGSESNTTGQRLTKVLKKVRLLMWLGYGCAVTAGLMIIGHAFGIASNVGFDTASATRATVGVVFGNMLGGFSAGFIADRYSSLLLIRWLPLFTSMGLIVLAFISAPSSVLVFFALGLVGYCYGAIIAVYPVAVANIFGPLSAAKIYGQIFTAWGLAGLLGPWTSGWIFDKSGAYSIALILAALLSVISVVAIYGCERSLTLDSKS